MDFYKKYSEDFNDTEKIVGESKEEGVVIHEKSISLEEILGFVTKKSIPIILLDWNIVKNKEEKGYQGHFVPIVGYDKDNVYVHNQGSFEKFLKIDKNIFDKARKTKGTDEDLAIIFNEPKTL